FLQLALEFLYPKLSGGRVPHLQLSDFRVEQRHLVGCLLYGADELLPARQIERNSTERLRELDFSSDHLSGPLLAKLLVAGGNGEVLVRRLLYLLRSREIGEEQFANFVPALNIGRATLLNVGGRKIHVAVHIFRTLADQFRKL